MKIIEITVNFIGRTTVETKGFSGSDCLEASRALEQALGVRQGEERTPEFYVRSSTKERVVADGN